MTKKEKVALQQYFTDAHNHTLRRLHERYPDKNISIKDLKDAPMIKLYPTKGDNNWVTCCIIDNEFVFFVQNRVNKMIHTVLTREQVEDRIRDWNLGITFTDSELTEAVTSRFNTLETWRDGMKLEGEEK